MRTHEAEEARAKSTRRRTWVPGPDLVIALVGIAGLILLATVVEEVERFEEREELTAFDAVAAQWIAENVPSRVFQLGLMLARIGSGVVVASFAFAAGVFAWSRRRRTEAVLIPVGALLLHLLVESLKALFGRARPAVGLSEAAGHSFPSGHAAFGAYLGVVILWLALHHVRRRGWMMGALCSAVAWALLQALGAWRSVFTTSAMSSLASALAPPSVRSRSSPRRPHYERSGHGCARDAVSRVSNNDVP